MMELLAQVNFENWFELAFVALVVIGTLVGNAVKAWNAKKEEREAARKAGSPFPEARAPREMPVELQELPPEERMRVPPIAPPVPELRRETQSELERLRRRARERQMGRPGMPPEAHPLPPSAPQPPPVSLEEARRLSAEQARRAAAEQSRRAAEEAARRTEQRRRERAEQERRERADRERREAARREVPKPASKAQRLSQSDESLDEREARLAKQRARRLGHVAEGTVPHEYDEVEPAPADAAPALARRLPPLTRNTLRDAIIMNEILAPPLSLRSKEDLP